MTKEQAYKLIREKGLQKKAKELYGKPYNQLPVTQLQRVINESEHNSNYKESDPMSAGEFKENLLLLLNKRDYDLSFVTAAFYLLVKHLQSKGLIEEEVAGILTKTALCSREEDE